MGANTNPVNNQAKQAVGSHVADNEIESEIDADLRTGGAKQKLSPSQDVEAVLDNADGAAAAEVGPLKHLADAPGNEMDG